MPRFVVGIPLPAVDGAYFEVFPLSDLDRTLGVLRNSIAVAAVATTLAGAAMGRWASRRVLAPVADVSAAAAAVAGGRLDVRLDERGDADLSSMAISFNRMTDALQARIERDARFASDVSHELRSPLTTLAAALEVVTARRDEMPERARQGLDLLSDEVGRFGRLVEDLLEISRIDAGVAELALEEVVLAEFVLHALRAGGAGIVPVEIEGPASGAVVQADKRRLERVVANLVDNAQRYGDGVTRVSVELGGAWVRLAVEDAGPGVPSTSGDGYSSGLPRCGGTARRRATARASGSLSSTSTSGSTAAGSGSRIEPGGGARFVVELPAV